MVRSSLPARVALFIAAWTSAGCLKVGEPIPEASDAGIVDASIMPDVASVPITLVPTTRPALDDFLVQGQYLGFAAESRAHQSEGTHFGLVRTYMNRLLYDSLAANNREHPQGAAAVMELYKSGQQLAGWAVLVKVAPQGNAGNGYFWFEAINGIVTTQETGVAACAQCHEVGRDLVLTTFPLR